MSLESVSLFPHNDMGMFPHNLQVHGHTFFEFFRWQGVIWASMSNKIKKQDRLEFYKEKRLWGNNPISFWVLFSFNKEVWKVLKELWSEFRRGEPKKCSMLRNRAAWAVESSLHAFISISNRWNCCKNIFWHIKYLNLNIAHDYFFR